ncbi:MAG TPA: hypothetical protein VF412_06480 [Bdellovibrio sp.]|uniref:hypothetical protein n=1 Tax=Bdellovibrio sp. TaxID=28201 RepID=UPI002F1B9072
MKFAKYLVLGLLVGSNAHAFMSIAESGEILPANTYQVGVEPQLLTDKNPGGNLDLFFDAPLNDSTSARLLLGGGSVDFNAFASVKWMPFPDVDKQPAMGLRVGAGVARDEDQNILQLQVAPMVSKKFDTDYGMSVPYLAVPFTFVNTKDDNFVATNLTVGSEFHYHEWKDVTLGGEVGLDLNKSWTYLSVFATFPFDSAKGFGK